MIFRIRNECSQLYCYRLNEGSCRIMKNTPANHDADEFSPARRDVLKAAAGIGVVGPIDTLFDRPSDEHVTVNVGYHDKRGFETAAARASDVLRRYAFDAATLVVPKKKATGETMQTLAANESIRYVERDQKAHAFEQTVPWGIDRIDADIAHERGATGHNADIAIIDTGIDADHPDLTANLGTGTTFTLGIGILATDEQNERVETRRQPLGAGLFPEWQDDNGHGTHCAGIADAVDNDQGVVGVSTEATLHAVKVLNALGAGSISDIAAGIEYVAQQGWDVGSMSLGTRQDSNLLQDACAYATAQGTLLVAAAGNSGPCTNCVAYPAVYLTTVAVGATTRNDTLASFSSTGSAIDLVAPGRDIRSTYLSFIGESYRSLSGTSMACPHVAGAGGLLMAHGSSNTDARQQLLGTAEDIGLSENEGGAGLLDVPAALNQV